MGQRTQPSISDHAKAHAIRLMRASHLRTLETTSERTYRRRVVPTAPAPRLQPAARKHRGVGWLPTSLIVPDKIPREARVPLKYYLPYYGSSKLGWLLYGRNQIDADLAWSPDLAWNDFFTGAPPGWGDPSDDATFASLRLQGPNPFTLRRVEPDAALGEPGDAAVFSLDFGRLFANVFPATEARFEAGASPAGLTPTSITIDGRIHQPGDAAWVDAKRAVNALDARYSVFIRHLLDVHLIVGQAFALAAYSLPVWHSLRPFMHFFTYGTLTVNDAAYKALLTPDSYFLRSNFVAPADARHMIDNAMRVFDFDEWVWPRDAEARGLRAIPDHPYVADADLLWQTFAEMVDEHLGALEVTDGEVRTDRHLARWHETLVDVLPASPSIPALDSRQDLATLMTALLWNNVVHEVCGNLAPILESRDPADLTGVNFEHLRAMVDPDRDPPSPAAADVLLMDQATYVSRFNVAGNNLMSIPAARYIDDPRLRIAVEGLQASLVKVGAELDRRNAERPIPFLNMHPSKFEVSISF